MKNYYRKTYGRKKKPKRFFKILGTLFLSFVLIVGLIGLIIFVYYARDLPRPEVFLERHQAMPTRIYDRTGKTLLRTIYGEERRRLVSLADVPDHVVKAVLATEDANFFQHQGIDPRGIVRAIFVNLRLRRAAQGASTISQQLIRSTFLTLERTVERKLREIILTLELERRYSKEQILEWYLNQIPLGINIYGVGEASRSFFDKPINEVTLAEGAILAALIQAPSRLYPHGPNREALLKRKNHVLRRMVKEDFISEETAQAGKEEEIKFAPPVFGLGKAPHFTLYVENYLFQRFGANFLREHGLRVYTTLDLNLQQNAERIVKEGVERNKKRNAFNASLVAIDPVRGEILAMVGSKDYFSPALPVGCSPGFNCKFEPQVNIAVFGKGQQPGSAFKPLVYAAAFEKNYSSDSIFIDEKTNFGKWGGKYYIPTNFDGRFRGPVTLKQSLAQSLNIPSVKVMLAAGIEKSIKTARALGITTIGQDPSLYGPALALGATEVKLLDMVSAYGVFAANGLRVSPTAILRIKDQNGNIIEEHRATQRRVLSEDTAQQINDILADNDARAPMFGPNSQLHFPNHWVASKTGTTDGFRDAWTVGYTPSIVAGVWVGNNDNSPTAKKPGVVLAAPIWRQFMLIALNSGF